jgi:carboxypeptidase Taq
MAIREKLEAALRRQALLASAIETLTWDQEVTMPKAGFQHRALVLGELASLHHENLTNKVLPLLAEALHTDSIFTESERQQLEIYLDEATPIQKIPADLVRTFSETASQAQAIWAEARASANYALFQPYLEKLVSLSQEKAAHLGYEEEPYEALLRLYEKSLRPSQVERLFAALRDFLIQTVQTCQEAAPAAVQGPALAMPTQVQRQLVETVLYQIGFRSETNRVDLSAHPFCSGLSPKDVRLTIRIEEEDVLMALGSAMHEMGHGLYEMGLPSEPIGWPATMPASLSIHESQSRFWENHIGNSVAFWEFLYMRVLPAYAPAWLTAYTPLTLAQRANAIQPHLIRIQSDEVSYHLHILLRFELERALINGDLKSGDLPAAWNEKTLMYLGLLPSSDAQGVLQDIHWSMGSFGYFPTYSLGSLYAAQFEAAIERAHPLFMKEVAQGRFETPLHWLRTHIHAYGHTCSSEALCEQATGEPLSPRYYQAYIRSKVAQLYEGLALPV